MVCDLASYLRGQACDFHNQALVVVVVYVMSKLK